MISKELKPQLGELQLTTYPFNPPESFRIQWASKSIQDEYAPKIARLSQDFIGAELLTVLHKERMGCIALINKEDLLYGSKLYQTLAEHGCYIHPLNYVPITELYSNEVQPLKENEPYHVRALITNNPAVPNMEKLGRILGYPDCCIEFFDNYWSKHQFRDLVPCMAGIQTITKPTVISDYYETCNILLKGMGIRATPHLPCSFKCQASNDFAHRFMKYLPDESYRFLLEMLRMETHYSTYHGYGEVKNKLFKNVFNSIALGNKLEFSLKQLLTVGKSDNGFTNKDYEVRAHHELVNFASNAFSFGSSRVLDLGCGDCSLLKMVGKLNPTAILEGVEIDRVLCENVVSRGGSFPIIFNQDLNEFIFNGTYSLVMISNQRIQEMDEDESVKFFNNIRESSKHLLIYDYNRGDIVYPINFSKVKDTKGIYVSMALYIPITASGFTTRWVN